LRRGVPEGGRGYYAPALLSALIHPTDGEEEFCEVPTILSLLSEEGASMDIPGGPGTCTCLC
jgi:hypothetical protein